MFRGFVDAGMFDGGNPDLALRIERPRKVVHDHVVGLGRPARPDDVRRMAAEKMRESFTRFPERGAGATPDLMRAGRIARNLLGGIEPGFARLAHHRRGGIVVEINHRPDRIQSAAALTSFLWALVKASGRNWAGVSQTPISEGRALRAMEILGVVELRPPS